MPQWPPHNSFWQHEIFARSHPPSTRGGEEPQGLWILCPVVFMYAKGSSARVGVFGGIMTSRAERPWELKTMDREVAHRMLWKMEIPMALELVSTKYLCLPLHALITTNFQGQPPQESVLHLLPTLFVCFIPCTDLLRPEKAQEYQSPAGHHPRSLFSSLPSLLAADTSYF